MSTGKKKSDAEYINELSSGVQYWRIQAERARSELHDAMAENYVLKEKFQTIKSILDFKGDIDDIIDAYCKIK